MQVLSGKQTSQTIFEELKNEVDNLISKNLRPPHLAAVLVGSDPASETYVGSKIRSCEKVGFRSSLVKLPDTITEDELLTELDKLNNDPEVDGYIVQLPLPAHINETKVTLAVAADKDVDGFHPISLGKMMLGVDTFVPATPLGIVEILKRHNIETSGKNCVVLGRSHIVGRPISILMSDKGDAGNATVTVAHSRTKNLADLCKSADILVVAIGKPNFVTADMVKEGAVVVDVGIHRIKDDSKKSGFRLTGDVDYATVSEKCSAITPVPGGVGPMTIAGLMLNTLKAYQFNM